MSKKEILADDFAWNINLDLLFIESGSLFWVIDLQFRILKFNKTFEDVLYDHHSLTIHQGESILELDISSDVLKKWEHHYRDAFNGENVVICEKVYDSDHLQQLITIKPLLDINNIIVGAYCSVTRVIENAVSEKTFIDFDHFCADFDAIDETILLLQASETEGYKMIYANKAFFKLTRISDGIGNKSLVNLLNPTDITSVYLKCELVTSTLESSVWSGQLLIGQHYELVLFKLLPVIVNNLCAYCALSVTKLFALSKQLAAIDDSKFVFYKALQFSNDIIFTLNELGVFVLVSDAVLPILGYQPQEISGTYFIDYVHESDIENTKSIAQIVETGANYSCESKYLHKNGSIVNMLWSASWDAEAKLMYCIGRNITDYKKIISKAQETQYLLNEAQRFSKMGSWNYDFKDNLLSWSDALYDVFETTKAVFVPSYNTFFDFVIDEDQHFVRQSIKKCAADGIAFNISYRIIVGDNKKRIIEAFGCGERDVNGTLTRIFGTAQDITERRKFARMLEKSNQKYKYLFENNPMPLYIFDFETLQIIDCNIEALYLYGYTREEFLKLTILDIRPKEDRELILEATASIEKYGTIHKKNWRHQKSNGELFYVEVTGHLIDYDGRKCSFVLITDVTDKMVLEKKEKEHTHFIETTLENLPIGIAVNKIEEGTATLMNQKFAEIYGWPKEILADFNTFYKNVYPDKKYRENLIQTIVSDIQSKDPARMNWEGIKITTQKGEKKIINAKNIAVYNQNLMMSVVVDVTERYNFQKSLEASNERYRYASKATSDAIWDWDLKSDSFYWGEGITTLFGYPYVSNEIHSSKTWFDLLHKDDLPIIKAEIDAVLLSSALNWTSEHRIIKNDGNLSYVTQRAIIIRDTRGKAIRLVGAIKDISHRKIREQQLKLFESVVTNANDAVLITEAEVDNEPEHKIIYVNDAFIKMTGYSLAEVVGKNPRFMQGPKSDFEELARLRNAIKLWKNCEITTINYDKAGNEFWVNFAISPVANEKGWFTHWVSIQRDVTDSKIEEQKRLLINEISTIFNKSTSLQEASGAVLKRISALFDYPLIGLWLLDDETETLNLISYNYSENSIITTEKFLNNTLVTHFKDKKNGLLGVAWRTGKIIKWSISNREFPVYLEDEIIAAGIQKLTAVPLIFNGVVIGAILIAEDQDKSRYNDKIMVSEEVCLHLGAEIKRKQLELELSKIFNFSPDVICVINANGKFKRINPAGCLLFGYTESELLQMNIIDLVHPEDFKKAKNKILVFIKKEQTVYFESRFVTRNGGIRWMVWTASSTEDGYIYSIGKDISDRKKAENQLKILNQDLIKQTEKLHISNEELEQFAYVASHDLQEPLRMVTSFLTLIEKKYSDKLDLKGLEYIKFAVEGAKNMRQIILDLLHFSRIADNEAHYEHIELSEIINDVCLLQSKLITEKNAKITFDNLPAIFSMRHYLQQLFQNLISNALKYSKDNVPVHISIASVSFKTYDLLSVTDNGIGIEQEYFDKIFILFQRLHRKDEYQGNGMGLAITKKIMDKLNGKIWVESEVGVGSTFYIKIPKKQVKL